MNLFTASWLRLSLVNLGASVVPNLNIRCRCVCSWFPMLNMLLLGKAASPCPGRPCHVGLAGAEEDEDDEVGPLVLSSLLSSRSLDRLGLDDRWDVSSIVRIKALP